VPGARRESGHPLTVLGGRRVQLGLLLAHTILVQAATFVLRPTATYQALNLSVPAARLSVLGVLALTAAGLAGAAVAAGGLHQTREEAHG
jgi:hypothetical protein